MSWEEDDEDVHSSLVPISPQSDLDKILGEGMKDRTEGFRRCMEA